MLLPKDKLPVSFNDANSAPEIRARLFDALHSTGIADKLKVSLICCFNGFAER